MQVKHILGTISDSISCCYFHLCNFASFFEWRTSFAVHWKLYVSPSLHAISLLYMSGAIFYEIFKLNFFSTKQPHNLLSSKNVKNFYCFAFMRLAFIWKWIIKNMRCKSTHIGHNFFLRLFVSSNFLRWCALKTLFLRYN